MTTKEAGERLGVSDRRILQFLKDGRLSSKRLGRIHIVKKQDVERLAQEQIEAAPKKRGPRPNVMKQEAPE